MNRAGFSVCNVSLIESRSAETIFLACVAVVQ